MWWVLMSFRCKSGSSLASDRIPDASLQVQGKTSHLYSWQILERYHLDSQLIGQLPQEALHLRR